MVEISKCRCGHVPELEHGPNGRDKTDWVQCSHGDCWGGPMRGNVEDAIAAWNELMTPKPSAPPAGTVRVRAKVWLDDDGTWNVAGGQWYTDTDWSENERWPIIAHITADIPLPQPAEIAGSVTAEITRIVEKSE